MKKIFLIAALVTLCFTSGAQSLEEVFTSITSSPVTSGSFAQEKLSAKLKRSLKSTGTYIICDQGILWQTEKPFPSSMAVTKTMIIQTRPDGTKNVTDGSSNEVFKSIAQTLSSMFSGSRQELESNFTVKNFNVEKENWTLLLEPKDKTIASVLNSIEMGGAVKHVVNNKPSLDLMKITQHQTETITYSFFNQTYRQELTDAEKAFFK